MTQWAEWADFKRRYNRSENENVCKLHFPVRTHFSLYYWAGNKLWVSSSSWTWRLACHGNETKTETESRTKCFLSLVNLNVSTDETHKQTFQMIVKKIRHTLRNLLSIPHVRLCRKIVSTLRWRQSSCEANFIASPSHHNATQLTPCVVCDSAH